MARKTLFVWNDAEFTSTINEAREALFGVFGLSHKSKYKNWAVAVSRILNGTMTSEEIDKAKNISLELFDDLVEHKQLPRVVTQLDLRLFADFSKTTLTSLAKEILGSDSPDKERLRFVVQSVHDNLLWQIIRNSHKLWRESKQGQSWHNWLENRAQTYVVWIGAPDAVFADFQILKVVGEAWQEYKVALHLQGDARQITREQIDDARREKAKQLSGTNPQGLYPLPEAIRSLMAILTDKKSVPRLHDRLAACINNEIKGRPECADHNYSVKAELKENAFLVLLEMIVWRIIKNAKMWFETTVPGATTWELRALSNLPDDAWKAVNYALKRPARGNRKFATVLYDSESINDKAAPESTHQHNKNYIVDLILKLSDDLRQPICLAMGLHPDTMEPVEPMGLDQVAHELQLSMSAVKLRIRKAQNELQELLKNSH